VLGISLSHPERVVFRDPGLTKLDLARYYERIAERMVPHVQGRPLTLVRCAGEIGEGCTFMRHGKVWGPEALRRVRIQEQRKLGEYLVADTPQALIALVQIDIVEIHTWNTRDAHVEQPDRIVIDLDPGDEVTWAETIAAARLVRDALAALKLESWVKTTGGRGLHVVFPLKPERDWSECLAFSRALAEAIVAEHPKRFTTAFAKRGRERKILLDYLRNNRTNTSIAAYSTRARAGAPVSLPICWDELTARLDPLALTVPRVADRIVDRDDPWRDYFRSRQRLTAAAMKAAGAR
jgi:bifunctional non-homologous end joining protein LigD